MHSYIPQPSRTQLFSEAVLSYFKNLIRITTLSGVALGIAAIGALVWANLSPDTYAAVWHSQIALALNDHVLGVDLHFFINDILMTVFFLAVGMEIRHEIKDGSLSNTRDALMPIIAAIGGVVVPAAIFMAFNVGRAGSVGWAIPTATDIAFALGVVAVLGKRIPIAARLFLLTLAVTDDIIAIVIIAIFYSGDLALVGFVYAGLGILLTRFMQHAGVSHALAYVLPGAIIWYGFLTAGIHPTLTGVILGLMTPTTVKPSFESPIEGLRRNLLAISAKQRQHHHADDILEEAKAIARTQRELIPPVIRVNVTIAPWVNFLIMPLFALANAGVVLDGLNITPDAMSLGVGIMVALLIGKPLGILGAVILTERCGIAKRHHELSWPILSVLSILGGIGFTMSIFVSQLALTDEVLVGAAKLAVLGASTLAIAIGIGLSIWLIKPVKI